MKLFTVHGIDIKINLLMLGCILLWALAGNISMPLTLACIVLLHEAAHCFVAFLLRLHTVSIELYPFGGAAQIEGIGDNHIYEGIIAAAGPLASLLTGFLWASGTEYGILPRWDDFIKYSYTVAMFNLLPAYPLDGGRILMSLFCSAWGLQKGRKRCMIVSLCLSFLLLAASIYGIIAGNESGSFSVMGLFLASASVKAVKNRYQGYRRQKLWYSADTVKWIKAHENDSLMEVASRFFGSSYFFVIVTDQNENILCTLSEKDIFEHLLKDSTMCLRDVKKRSISFEDYYTKNHTAHISHYRKF